MKYDQTTIAALSAVQSIRQRPERYLPKSSNIRNALLLEALCLSLAEAHCGTCESIKIEASDRTAVIADNGLGLSVEKDIHGSCFAERIFSELYACRDHKSHQQLAHQLCGAGIVVVNAFSEAFTVEIHTAGLLYRQTYQHGIAESSLCIVGSTNRTGTTLTFTIAEEFAGTLNFDLEALRVAVLSKDLDLSKTNFTIEPMIENHH